MRYLLRKRTLRLRSALAFSLLALMVVGGFEPDIATNAQAQPPSHAPQYSDYGLAALGANDSISLAILQKGTNGNLSVGSFKHFIQASLLTYDIRKVLLDIGWDNFTISNIPQEAWVNNWLSACDSLGVGNVIFVSQLTKYGVGSTWVTSLIRADPSTQTYYPTGKAAPYVSPDNPDVLAQLERDLAKIYSYYGNHSSWIGIGTGSTSLDPYFGPGATMSSTGYSNATIVDFANSQYFAADVNSAGYDLNGTLDKLWSEFRNVPQSLMLSSGNWQLSIPASVYGTNSSGNSLAMRFYLPQNESGVQVEWYGRKSRASAGDLLARIVGDTSGSPSTKIVVSSQIESPSSITLSSGWQGPLTFSGNLTRGYYWLYLASPASNSSNSYKVFMRNYLVDDLYAKTEGTNSSGRWSTAGESVLWLKSSSGSDLSIYPYEQPLVIPRTQQSFIANYTFSFNSVYLFLSDRHFNPTNGTITIFDRTLNETIDSGVLSQAETHGLQNWIPIPLDHVATAIAGHSYLLSISEPRSGFSWIVALRGLTADPPRAGFQGQGQFWLFRLALLNWGQSHFDFTADVPNGFDAVSRGHPDAVDFKVPGVPGGSNTISELSIYMERTNPSSRFYPSNVSMTVSIKANNLTSGSPAGPPLQSLNVMGTSIPQRGWLNVTGYNLPLLSGATYWVVFGTNSTGTGFPLARLVSPYNLKVLISPNGGSTWTYPVEGPSDAALVVRFASGSQVGNFIQDTPIVGVSGAGTFAQPFIESNSTEASGVFVGPIKRPSVPDAYLEVSINSDNGTGHPSGEVLAEGRIYAGNITLDYGLQFVQFTSVARLQAGQRYWIVLQGTGGKFGLEPVVYSYEQQNIPSLAVSSNGGYTWKSYSNLTTILSYRIETPMTPLPTYDTAQIFETLLTHHDISPTSNPSAGWNSFILSLELQRETSLATWLDSSSGKTYDFYGSTNQGTLANSQHEDFVDVQVAYYPSTCNNLYSYILSSLPFETQQYLPMDNLNLMRSCPTPQSDNLLGQMNIAAYQGSLYGLNTTSNVLVLGGQASDNLAERLSMAYNTTFVDVETNPILASTYVIRSNTVIVIESNLTLGAGLVSSLDDFVHRGGTIIALGPSAALEGAIDADTAGMTSNSTVSLQRQVGYWMANTVFAQKLNINLIPGAVNATGLGLRLEAKNAGSGQMISLSEAGLTSLQSSDSFVVLSNIIANSLARSSSSPFWNGPGYGNSLSPALYGIKGVEEGQVLVWASNPNQASGQFEVSLNGSYYHLPNQWKVIDLASFKVYEGKGNVVTVGASIRPMAWDPLYVISDNASIRGDYSSLALESDLRYPNQALLTSHGPANQSALIVLTPTSAVSSMTLNGNVVLQKIKTLPELISVANGWYFDNSTNTLFIKWQSTFVSSLRMQYASSPPPVPPPILPESVFLGVFLALLLVEIGVLAYLRLTRSQKSEELHQAMSRPRD